MDPISTAFALSQFVPGILKWITGSDKAEAAAAAVIDIAKQATGQQTGEQALVAIKADPAALLAFRQAMAAQEADLDKAFLVDRQDARRRDVELRKLGDHNKRADLMIAMDALGLLAGFGGMLALGYVKAKHPDSITEGVFGALLAQLSTITSYFGLCLRDAHQFEFGSSRGSRIKDERGAQG